MAQGRLQKSPAFPIARPVLASHPPWTPGSPQALPSAQALPPPGLKYNIAFQDRCTVSTKASLKLCKKTFHLEDLAS